MFESKLKQPPTPSSDVFNYIFHHGRRPYAWSKVLYRVHGTDETLTLAQLEEKSRKLATVLKNQYDIKPNNVISIWANDRIQFPIAFFGALAAGATVALTPVQSGMAAEDVASRLVQAESKLLITDSDNLRIAEHASCLAGCVPLMTMDKSGDSQLKDLESAIKDAPADVACFQIDNTPGSGTHDAFINRTSGSTGPMKSVITTHQHYIATMEGTVGTVPETTDPEKDTWLASSSLGFFINAKLFMSLNILLGVPVVIMPKPLDETNISVIKDYGITFILIFPPLVAKLAKSGINSEHVKSIKWLLSAGASIPENLRGALREKFPNVDLTLEWGTSETMLIAIQTSTASSRKRGSSGTLVNGMQARVIDTQTNCDLGPGQKGEILVRNSLAPFKGYKNNDKANEDFDDGGWFHTGDYGYVDNESNVYIIDRLKELLRVGDGYGSRISVSELENAVFEHPAVHSVIVVGVHDEALAVEKPTAFVVPTVDHKDRAGPALAAEILDSVSGKLTGLKSLSGGVYFLEHYPMTGFKINRKALKTIEKDDTKKTVKKEDTQGAAPPATAGRVAVAV